MPVLSDEQLRLKDLQYYDILDTEKETSFDELVELASTICNCPKALISFIDKERQWFKAGTNVGVNETSREISVCSLTILQDDVLVIYDVKNDERFIDNPMVANMGINFYAGAPIFSNKGYKLGTVCVLDTIPRQEFSLDQKKALKIIAQQVSKLLELRVTGKVIKKQADAQIKMQKKIIEMAAVNNRKRNVLIGDTLHENFAQTLAAVRLYLETSERSKDLSAYFIQKSKDCISDMIIDMKTLAKSVYSFSTEGAK